MSGAAGAVVADGKGVTGVVGSVVHGNGISPGLAAAAVFAVVLGDRAWTGIV